MGNSELEAVPNAQPHEIIPLTSATHCELCLSSALIFSCSCMTLLHLCSGSCILVAKVGGLQAGALRTPTCDQVRRMLALNNY